MRRTHWLTAAVAALALAACGPDEETQTAQEELAQTAETSEGFEEADVPAPPTPVPDTAANLTVTGSLAGPGGEPRGSATLTSTPAGTQVGLNVRGYAPNSTLQAGIARGQCGSPGEVAAQLGTLTVNAEGIGTLQETAPIPAPQVMDGRHAVLVYLQGEGAVVNAACMNVPPQAEWR